MDRPGQALPELCVHVCMGLQVHVTTSDWISRRDASTLSASPPPQLVNGLHYRSGTAPFPRCVQIY